MDLEWFIKEMVKEGCVVEHRKSLTSNGVDLIVKLFDRDGETVHNVLITTDLKIDYRLAKEYVELEIERLISEY